MSMNRKDDTLRGEALKKELKRKGKIMLTKMLESHGGTLSPADTALKLNVSVETLSKLKTENRIFSVTVDNNENYPTWQFNESTRERVQTILEILAPHSDVAKLRFFLIHDSDLNGRTRLKALEDPTKDELYYIHREAKVYYTHGCK